DVLFLLERGVVIPTHTEVQSKILVEPPIILKEQCVVVISQMDFIRLGREAAGCRHCEEAGVNRTEREKVVHCCEQLKIQNLRFDTVDMRTEEIPTELHIMIAKQFRRVGGH